MHQQMEISIVRKVFVDVEIAQEIVWLNKQGVCTVASCQGPPPTALIKPSSVSLAERLGYRPEYQPATAFHEIRLGIEIPVAEDREWLS